MHGIFTSKGSLLWSSIDDLWTAASILKAAVADVLVVKREAGAPRSCLAKCLCFPARGVPTGHCPIAAVEGGTRRVRGDKGAPALLRFK